MDGRGLVVKVQLLKSDGYPPWPTEVRSLDQRDLWDLWALAGVGAIDADAAAVIGAASF